MARAAGEVDPATEKMEVYSPPPGMDGPTTVAGTIDVDGKGKIWASTGVGAVRFDPDTKQFKEFKSPTYKNADGIGNTYGLAADGDGNGWWAQMNMDVVTKGDIETGQSHPVHIPPSAGREADVQPRRKSKMYAGCGLNLEHGRALGGRPAPHGRGQERATSSGCATGGAEIWRRSTRAR